ncbi:BP80 [Symbiodinium microadriaticum]|nr:BP80 [Symbiodinium microadriaticum]
MAHIPEPRVEAAEEPQGLKEGASVPEAEPPTSEEELRASKSPEEPLEEGSLDAPVAEADPDPSPRALESESKGSFMATALQPEQGYASDLSKLPASNTGYSYPQFVERFKDQSAQPVVNEVRDFVNRFPANLTRLQAARRIHAFLAEVTPKLLAAKAFRDGGENVASELANEGLEKFVVLKLYKLLFRHDPADIREDERVEQALRSAAKGASAKEAAVAKFDAKQLEVFDAAVLELQMVEQHRAPRDKLSCFVNAIRLLESIVVERVFRQRGEGQQTNWEQLLTALILKASPPNLYSNLEFTAAFRHPALMGPDERKALADLASAFLAVIGGSSRRLASAELAENSVGQSGSMPLWLMDAGVTFNFSDRSPDDLSLGEVDELLDEYQRMIRAIRARLEMEKEEREAEHLKLRGRLGFWEASIESLAEITKESAVVAWEEDFREGVAMAAGAWPAAAGIRVVTPPELLAKLHKTHGRISGSTATFGAPFYGDTVKGRLVYGISKNKDNHCTPQDYDVPKPETFETEGSTHYQKVKLLNIIIVRRGKCSFTTKVKVAQDKGAHAVIIVDREDSSYTAEGLANVIVADDGYGSGVHIPSILISKDDGQQLINTVQSTEVVIELAWNVPTDHVVTMDMWMSSGSSESMQFIKDFAPKRKELNQVMIFNPHYAVFSMEKTNPAVYSGVCLDEGKYCANDPDGAGDVTGKDVLLEDVRQLCIHETTKVTRASMEVMQGLKIVEYAEKYWDYMEKYPLKCPVDGSGSNKFGEECSIQVMKEVNINPDEIIQCAMTTRWEKLKQQLQNTAWSDQAIRVNGWRFSGVVTADLVVRAVCSGFIHEPTECANLIEFRDVFKPYQVPVSTGVSFGELLAWLLATVGLGFVCMLMYKRYLKREMHSTLREEVMLEVQAQMGDYAQLRGA